MSSNYPPGVSGNEPQITGEWRCSNCGAILPEEIDCKTCGDTGVTSPDENGQRDPCPDCERAREQLRDGECPGGCDDGPDPDRQRDEELDRQLEGRDRYDF